MSETVSLASLLTPSKTVEISFPGHVDFKVSLCCLAREELVKLRKRCLTTKFDRTSKQPIEILDDEKFVVEYTKAVVKGWAGLKYKYLEELLLVDISGQDPEGELVYSEENAVLLMKNSTDFDSWVTDTVSDIENFTKDKSNE